MKHVTMKLGVIQNLGWFDRVVRVAIGGALLAYPAYVLFVGDVAQMSWAFYSMLFSVYPFLTGIIGYDPIYDALTVKSCGLSERNPCGTFPFEIDAALGNRPIPRSDIEHSLEHSRH